MTDHAAALSPPHAARRDAAAAPRRAHRRPSATRVVSGALAVFLACFAFLAWQLRSGQDPSLGSPVASAPLQQVLVKRIHRKVVVTDVLPAEADDAAVAANSVTSGSSTQVVQSAAPAPAPAPTTRSS